MDNRQSTSHRRRLPVRAVLQLLGFLLFLLLHDLLAIEVKIEIVHGHFLVKDIHSRDNLLTLAEQLRHLF